MKSRSAIKNALKVVECSEKVEELGEKDPTVEEGERVIARYASGVQEGICGPKGTGDERTGSSIGD